MIWRPGMSPGNPMVSRPFARCCLFSAFSQTQFSLSLSLSALHIIFFFIFTSRTLSTSSLVPTVVLPECLCSLTSPSLLGWIQVLQAVMSDALGSRMNCLDLRLVCHPVVCLSDSCVFSSCLPQFSLYHFR